MNHLAALASLSNQYFVLRHGHSLANQQKIIVSDPLHGCDDYGLSEQGILQVRDSLQRDNQLGPDLRILSSDFKRAQETAEIAHRYLACEWPLQLEPRLRERDFGELELTADTAYDEVWRADLIDADSCFKAAESANQVTARVTSVVRDCETRFQDQQILLVSHGDILQLLQTAFRKQAANTHRQLPSLQTAEIRRLILVAD